MYEPLPLHHAIQKQRNGRGGNLIAYQQADVTHQTARHWWAMRQHAIEIGAIAEAELIRLGELGHEDRAVLTKKERRAMAHTAVKVITDR